MERRGPSPEPPIGAVEIAVEALAHRALEAARQTHAVLAEARGLDHDRRVGGTPPLEDAVDGFASDRRLGMEDLEERVDREKVFGLGSDSKIPRGRDDGFLPARRGEKGRADRGAKDRPRACPRMGPRACS